MAEVRGFPVRGLGGLQVPLFGTVVLLDGRQWYQEGAHDRADLARILEDRRVPVSVTYEDPDPLGPVRGELGQGAKLDARVERRELERQVLVTQCHGHLVVVAELLGVAVRLAGAPVEPEQRVVSAGDTRRFVRTGPSKLGMVRMCCRSSALGR